MLIWIQVLHFASCWHCLVSLFLFLEWSDFLMLHQSNNKRSDLHQSHQCLFLSSSPPGCIVLTTHVPCVCVFAVGMVYNVSAYMDFHPGGEAELMRAAGIDSTDLFDQVKSCRSRAFENFQKIVCFNLECLQW